MTFGSSFYATIAQIVPVFWLALIVESRVRQRQEVGHLESAVFGGISILAALIEFSTIALMTTSSPPNAAGVAVLIGAYVLINSMLVLSLGRTSPRQGIWAAFGAVCVGIPLVIITHLW